MPFALATALLLWASLGPGIRAGLKGYTPTHLAIIRFAVASLGLAIHASLVPCRRPPIRDIIRLAVTGLIGITFYTFALNYGEQAIPAGSTSLLISSSPIWASLIARFVLGERLNVWGWTGIMMSFAGVA